MRKSIGFWMVCLLLITACNSNKNPDISNIKVATELKRFDRDFFAIDTNQMEQALHQLSNQYPEFLNDYLTNILGLSPKQVAINNDPEQQALKMFLRDYKPVKDSVEKLFGNFKPYAAEIEKALKYVKYYFPTYPIPKEIITFIGPIDASFQTIFGAQGDVLTDYALGIGLQLHMGREFSFYNSPQGQYLYPNYIVANFDPEHIVVNCMRNIVDDLFPTKPSGSALLEQMVEMGKRLYLISRFLPDTKEALILNYSDAQYKDCMAHEGFIWSFFLKNDLLNNSEQNLIKNYLGEGPKTPELGEDSPGNIGSFAGLQIVKKYVEKFPDTQLPELMKMPPREIYTLSKYKPRN